jgi:hypothetical protein
MKNAFIKLPGRLLAGVVYLLGSLAHAHKDGVPQPAAAPAMAAAAAAPVPGLPEPAIEIFLSPDSAAEGAPVQNPLAGLTPDECAEVFAQAAGSVKRQSRGAGLPLYSAPDAEGQEEALVDPVWDTPTAVRARERRRRFDEMSQEQQDAVCLQALVTVKAMEGARSRDSLSAIPDRDGSVVLPTAGLALEGEPGGASQRDEAEEGSLKTASEEAARQLSPTDQADIGRARWHRMSAEAKERVLKDAAWLAKNRKLVDIYLAQMNAPQPRPQAQPKKSWHRRWCCGCCD